MPKAKKNPFTRLAGSPTTKPRSFVVPKCVIKEIRAVTPGHGSQGRALQVATEMVTRDLKKAATNRAKARILRQYLDAYTGVLSGPEHRITYKLLPSTIARIDELTEVFGDEAKVFAACAVALKGQPLPEEKPVQA